MPPLNSTGGDLVEQLREWFDRQRERLDGRKNGATGRTAARRPTRRSSTRVQAVPIGSARASAGRPNRYGRQRVDRAARCTYTIVLGAVLLILIVVLFFALTSLMPSSSSGPT